MATAERPGGIPVCLPARPARLCNVETVESRAENPPAPVLIVVAVVGRETNDGLVVRAGIVEIGVPVIDPARPVMRALRGTDRGDQRLEQTVLTVVAVCGMETTDECGAARVPAHVAIPVVDPTMPRVAGDPHPVLVGAFLVRPLLV